MTLSLDVKDIILFSNALSHESFAALLTIIEIGSEKLIDSEINFSHIEFYDSLSKNKAQLLEARKRKEVFFLEKVGGLKVYIQEGLKEADLAKIKFNQQKEYWNKSFDAFQSQRKTNYCTIQNELKRLIIILKEHHESLENQLNTINRCQENDERRAPLILSTTHKIKGREWDRVMLLNDFISPDTLKDFREWERDNKLNILYVAATRAVRELYVPHTHIF